MCGIFGVVSKNKINNVEVKTLARHSEQRGKDSSGLYFSRNKKYTIVRDNRPITKLLNKIKFNDVSFLMGHSRLITNGFLDNQPIFRDSVCVIHNGILVNEDEIWAKLEKKRLQEIDSEGIAAIAAEVYEKEEDFGQVVSKILELCKGVVACAIAFPKIGKLLLFSNNGSLYLGKKEEEYYFASESYGLQKLGCVEIKQIRDNFKLLNIPISNKTAQIKEQNSYDINLIPNLGKNKEEEKFLEYSLNKDLKRCKKCILPQTMPFIYFDSQGICNYCKNYSIRNKPKPIEELLSLVEKYRRKGEEDCIVPFSGGRDSCFSLHLIAKELKMKAIAYTYDWGMVTDLGRRNISRMCSILGVENIIVADDISLKRRNIASNLKAWLKSPHLGMISILTAGDKHFFRHVETVKKQTGISLNLWGVNPLEVTHFKSGFLGVPPDFEEEKVYLNSNMKQLRYQSLRFKAMLKSLGYFNNSLWDTISGEYYRSVHKKTDYFHLFDYWRFDEGEVNDVLLNNYDWECASDTNTTWRIGDGTAAFYNYIYYTVAGFSEHDTFRSNQIREGDIKRDEAIELLKHENKPRYPNIKWYIEAIGLDYKEVINKINRIPKIF